MKVTIDLLGGAGEIICKRISKMEKEGPARVEWLGLSTNETLSTGQLPERPFTINTTPKMRRKGRSFASMGDALDIDRYLSRDSAPFEVRPRTRKAPVFRIGVDVSMTCGANVERDNDLIQKLFATLEEKTLQGMTVTIDALVRASKTSVGDPVDRTFVYTIKSETSDRTLLAFMNHPARSRVLTLGASAWQEHLTGKKVEDFWGKIGKIEESDKVVYDLFL